MTGKQIVMERRTIELMRGHDPDRVTVLAIHRVVAKGGHELHAIQAFADAYNCELDIFEKERILIKDVFIQVKARTADLILFYMAYSDYFGEPKEM